MKLTKLTEAMTKLELAAKYQIEDILNEQGYPTYAKLLSLFDINLTSDPDVIGYMIPDKAKIVLNKDLDIDQVSVIVRHEILHQFLMHALRDEKFRAKNSQYKDIPHELVNVAADYEISNLGYTDKDKKDSRNIRINGQVLRGLVTEDDHPGWENKSFEDMLKELADEHKDDMEYIKQMMQRMGSSNDSEIQQAEEIERQANAIKQSSNDAGTKKQAQKIQQAAAELSKEAQEKEDGKGNGDVFKSPDDAKDDAELAQRVENIKKALSDLKNKEKLSDENREAKKKEREIRVKGELDKYKNSPIVRFKESLSKFIKNELYFEKNPSWRKFNKTYARSDVLKPGKAITLAPVPLINIYYDRSGSWDAKKTEEGSKAIATLNKYVRQGQIKIKVYYFSNNVHTVEKDAVDEGGTDGQPILDHIEQTKPTNVIILTDSDISDCVSDVTVPGAVWFLFYGGRSENLMQHLHGRKLTRAFDMQ